MQNWSYWQVVSELKFVVWRTSYTWCGGRGTSCASAVVRIVRRTPSHYYCVVWGLGKFNTI